MEPKTLGFPWKDIPIIIISLVVAFLAIVSMRWLKCMYVFVLVKLVKIVIEIIGTYGKNFILLYCFID